MRNILGCALATWSSCIATTLLLGCGAEPPEDIDYKTASSDLTLDSDTTPGTDVSRAPKSLKSLPLEKARDAIRKHWLEKFANQKDVVATTETRDGSVFDWFEAEKGLKVPPRRPLPPLPKGDVYAQSVLEAEPEAIGPPNTVPSVRPDVEALLQEWGDTVPDDPDKLLDIARPPAPDGNGYYHAAYYMTSASASSIDLSAMYARLNLWFNSSIAAGDHAITQIWMGAGAGGDPKVSNQLDTIEAGSRQTSTRIPYLFVYFQNNNYFGTQDPTLEFPRYGGQPGYAARLLIFSFMNFNSNSIGLT